MSADLSCRERKSPRKRGRGGVLLVLFVSGLSGCNGCPPTPAPAASKPAAWSTAARQVAYTIKEGPDPKLTTPPWWSPRQFSLDLEFTGGGGVVANEMGVKTPGKMDPSGRFQMNDPDGSPLLYELIALSIVPPTGQLTGPGQKWEVLRPSDSEAQGSDAIVGQEKYEYEVTAINGPVVSIKITGSLRLAPSKGLDKWLGKHGGSFAKIALSKAMLALYAPYVSGTAEFNVDDGSTVSAHGTMRPWSYGLSPTTDIASDPGRIEYDVARK